MTKLSKLFLISILMMLVCGGCTTSESNVDSVANAPSATNVDSGKVAVTEVASDAKVLATTTPVEEVKVEETKVEDKKEAKPLPKVNTEDPIEIVQFIIQAFKDGQWGFAIGLLITLLTLLFNTILKQRIPKKVVPWVAIGLGIASAVAMSFASGVVWYKAIGSGLTFGLAAIGGWEAFMKMFKKEKSKEEEVKEEVKEEITEPEVTETEPSTETPA